MKLNKRLETIALKIKENAQVLDVGCDHALLDIFLVLQNKNIRAVASDIKEGPIEKAKENIKKYNLENQIKTRIGPGIQTIDENIDTVVISGMGGLNMIGILKYYPNLLKNVKTIILSPNNYPKEVRKEITKLGYFIKDEELVEENNFIYPILIFEKGKKKYKEKEYAYGPILLEKKTPLLKKYLEEQKNSKMTILKLLPKKYFKRKIELKKEIKDLKKIIISLKEASQ